MPSQSKSQQRFFGVVKAMQKGDIPKKGKAGKIAKQMSKKDVDDFASTKHKGKPEKVKREQRVRSLIKKMVREELNKMNEVKDSYVVWSPLLNKVYDGPVSEKEALKLIKKYAKQGQYHVGMLGTKYFNKTKLGKKNPVNEGTCGYGVNGQLGEEPAGPHLIKKKKIKESWDSDVKDFGKKSGVKVKPHSGTLGAYGAKPVKPEISKKVVPFFKKKGYKLIKQHKVSSGAYKGDLIFVLQGKDKKKYMVSVNTNREGTNINFNLEEGKLSEQMNEALNSSFVKKMEKAVLKGKDVVVYDKKGKKYSMQSAFDGGKGVAVTDYLGSERTYQELPMSKVKKIVIEGKLTSEQKLRESIREIIKEQLNEKTFGSKAQYDAYRKKHTLKPGTKVKVAGKTITVRGKGKMSKTAKSTADRMADKLNKKMDALNKKRKKGKMVRNAAGDMVPASSVAGHPDFKSSAEKSGKPHPGERDPSVRKSRKKKVKKEGNEKIPGELKRYMDRFLDKLKDRNLVRAKKKEVLKRVLQTLGISPKELQMYMQRVKREI